MSAPTPAWRGSCTHRYPAPGSRFCPACVTASWSRRRNWSARWCGTSCRTDPGGANVKFSIAVNMERSAPDQDVRKVVQQMLELVRLAESGGFEIAWSAEHHAIELMAGQNPFTILMHWAARTSRIRLGTAVVVAPYWHPIRVAGEAALFDVFSDGRLELGLGRGAFQYEFDRMAGGMDQREGGEDLRELLPVVRRLWAGD